MKKVIVSGATGFIGTHLCEELVNNDIEVIALVRNNSPNIARLPKNVDIVVCGMDEYDSLHGICADEFYHLAWEGTTGPGRDDETLQVRNISRSVAALHAAKKAGCKRFVALGTVYEKLVDQILDCPEHRKVDFYLLSKLSAHQICLKMAQKENIEFVWASIFQPIGKYLKTDQIMYYTVEGLLRGESPTFGPAMEPYDITAVENIAYGLRLLGECELTQNEYYIGSGKPMLLKDYLLMIKDVLESQTELHIGDRPDDGLRFSFDWYSIFDLEKDTGYKANKEFDSAIMSLADWIREKEKRNDEVKRARLE